MRNRAEILRLTRDWPLERIVAATLWGEIRNGNDEQVMNVAHVIRNRVRARLRADGKDDWWGEGYNGVCLARAQFSCWWDTQQERLLVVDETDTAYARMLVLARQIMNWRGADPTNGSTHYHTVTLTPPNWGEILNHKTLDDGKHIFYRDPTARLPEDAERTLARATPPTQTGPATVTVSQVVNGLKETETVKTAADNMGVAWALPYVTVICVAIGLVGALAWWYRRGLSLNKPWAIWVSERMPSMPWDKRNVRT